MIIDMLVNLTAVVLGVAAFIVCAFTIHQTINYLQALSDSKQDPELQPLLGVVYPEPTTKEESN